MVTLLLGLAFLKTLNETTIFINETTRKHQPGQKETEKSICKNVFIRIFQASILPHWVQILYEGAIR